MSFGIFSYQAESSCDLHEYKYNFLLDIPLTITIFSFSSFSISSNIRSKQEAAHGVQNKSCVFVHQEFSDNHIFRSSVGHNLNNMPHLYLLHTGLKGITQ